MTRKKHTKADPAEAKAAIRNDSRFGRHDWVKIIAAAALIRAKATAPAGSEAAEEAIRRAREV